MSSDSELQTLLEAAERDCRRNGSGAQFRDVLLQHLHHQTAAVSVRLWNHRDDDAPTCVARCGRDQEHPPAAELRAATAGVVDRTLLDLKVGNSTAVRLLTSSSVADGIDVILEVITSVPEQATELMEPVCDVLADLQRRQLTGQLLGREQQLLRAVELVSLLHADLNRERVVNTLASDAGLVFGCERVSVCRRVSASRWAVTAATSVSDPNRRADAVRNIVSWVEKAADAAVQNDEPGSGSPDAESSGESQRSSSDQPMIIPLSGDNSWRSAQWAAVLEGVASEDLNPAVVKWVTRHAAIALRNCDRLANATLLSRLARAPRTLFSTRPMIVAAVVIVALTVFLLGSTEFRIEAFGQIVPVRRARVFTPDSGIIASVSVSEGDRVDAGMELFRLRNDDVDLALQTVSGDLAASEARLAALESLRGGFGSDRNAMLSGEQAELIARVASLKKQHEILSTRLKDLTVSSRICGTVYGDFFREHLQGRPVQRAQYLFDVADPESGWQLELNVPELEIRHVLEADRAVDSRLAISYTLETSPEATLMTELKTVDPAVGVDPQGQLSTRVTADLSAEHPPHSRPGAGVVAYIHCGQRSRAYVYFRRVVEFMQRQIL